MRIELTEEERAALLRLVEEALQESKYPLSRETEALRALATKLRGEGEHKRPRR